jgi:hypothetical protein
MVSWMEDMEKGMGGERSRRKSGLKGNPALPDGSLAPLAADPAPVLEFVLKALAAP